MSICGRGVVDSRKGRSDKRSWVKRRNARTDDLIIPPARKGTPASAKVMPYWFWSVKKLFESLDLSFSSSSPVVKRLQEVGADPKPTSPAGYIVTHV